MKPQNFKPTRKQMDGLARAYSYGFKILDYVPDYLADDGYLHFTGARGHGIIHMNAEGVLLSNKMLDLCRLIEEKQLANSPLLNN